MVNLWHVANLWSLRQYPSAERPWSADEQLDAIKAAGFDGILDGNKDAERELFIVPEMGPVSSGYNLQQLPNSWEDAIRLRPILEALWLNQTAPSPQKPPTASSNDLIGG
jgi:hypothetical protein